jgi:ABC-type polysaccharide/polyol phosphate transport system ATPase subunit
MALIQVAAVSKAFQIPRVRRETIREHVFSAFRRRRFDRFQALDSVSFEIERGETVGIMGPNGSGKSTLLKILCGIYRPDRGSVAVGGAITPILELGIGWNPELDAIDNVHLLGSVMGLSLREIRRDLDQILAFAELERFANLELKHYSSGMASRLAYSVAFHTVKEILVLDEIFAVGDAAFRARCEERYRQLCAAGHTVLLVSHDPHYISDFCDRALLLDQGHIVMRDSGANVVKAYLERLTPSGVTP